MAKLFIAYDKRDEDKYFPVKEVDPVSAAGADFIAIVWHSAYSGIT